MAPNKSDPDAAIYIISVAAELAGVHPQTLRVYERKGLVSPKRTQGNTRRYSEKDLERLRLIGRLSAEGINLAGITRIIELQDEIKRLAARYERALNRAEQLEEQLAELLDAREHMAMVPLRDVRRIRRAMKSDDVERSKGRRTFIAPPGSGS